MPIFSRALEKTLHRALSLANERRHEYATLEHLLLALIDDSGRGGGDARLQRRSRRSCARRLIGYVDTELENLVIDDGEEAKPTAGFQRVVQRAAIHVQSSGREEVTGANVLVAIFAERESHAAYLPAGAGHDPLRRGQLHQPRHRQAAGPVRPRPVAARRRRGQRRATRRSQGQRRVQEEGSRARRLLRQPQQEGEGRARSIR